MWVVLISIAADIFLAYQFYNAAVEKGYTSIKYFLIPVFFILFGYLLIIALPDRGVVYPGGSGAVQGNGRNKSSNYNDLPEL